MKIVLFYKALVNPGGAERLIIQEWLQFRRLGHDVKILAFYADSKALYGMDEALADDLYVCKGATWAGKLIDAHAFIKRFNADVLVTTSGVIELFFLSRLRSTPYFIHLHQPCSMSLQEYLKFTWLYRQYFDWLCERTPAGYQFREIKASLSWWQILSFNLRSMLFKHVVERARAVLVMSNYAKYEAERLLRVPVVNLQGALDADFQDRYRDVKPLGDEVGHPLILTVARLDPNKRIDVLIRAFALLAQKVPHAQCAVIGSGSERERLAALIVELGLQGRCRLLGYVDEADLKRWYKTCDVFVTIDWADFRLTSFEAWAAGKQVILSNEAEVNDDLAASGFVHLSVPEPAPLADAIQTALARGPQLDERKLPPMLAHYTWEAYVKQIETLCIEAVGR